MTVNKLEEARDWFTTHSSGSLLCKCNGKEKLCDSYPEAEEFFKSCNVATEPKE